MPDVTVYATKTDLRARIDPTGVQTYSATDDAVHDAVILALCRAVDRHCGDFFGQVTQTRVFTAQWHDLLVVPSLVSVSTGGLKTDETGVGTYGRTWSATDFVLCPDNAALETPARPYLEIRVDTRSTSTGYAFPTTQRGVQLAGVFGWPAVPSQVKEVVLLESQRFLQQIASPTAVVASPELGAMMLEPSLMQVSRMMLAPFRRVGNAVAVWESAT